MLIGIPPAIGSSLPPLMRSAARVAVITFGMATPRTPPGYSGTSTAKLSLPAADGNWDSPSIGVDASGRVIIGAVKFPGPSGFYTAVSSDGFRFSAPNVVPEGNGLEGTAPGAQSRVVATDNELTEAAFRKFFDDFELISCPTEIQRLSQNFKIEVEWRRPHGFIKDQFDPTGSGKAFPALRTVFIKEDATPQTWYHEFAHVLYWCIKNNAELLEISKRLQETALNEYPVVTHEQMTPVLHPKTRQEVPPAPGRYVLINGVYLGLDHSGDGAEGEADELWAVLFSEYQQGGVLKENVRALITELIDGLRSVGGQEQ